MTERDRIEQLDQAVAAAIAGVGAPPSSADAELVELAAIAAALRELPAQAFRDRLRAELMEEAGMTAVNPIREGFHTVTPYLVVNGAARLMDFVKQAFGAEELARYPLPDGSILHAEARIGDSMLEMADAGGPYPPMPTAIHLYVKDVDAVYRQAVAAGAVSSQGPIDQPYGDREAGIQDPAGNRWYIATHQGAAHVPEGLRSVTPFLHPIGAAKVIDFLKTAFGAEEAGVYRSPEGVIVHARIRIGDSIVEMGEAHGEWQPMPSAIHLYVEDTDSIYRRALQAGAKSLTEPADQPYGDRSAGVVDPFGNYWFIATHIRDVSA